MKNIKLFNEVWKPPFNAKEYVDSTLYTQSPQILSDEYKEEWVDGIHVRIKSDSCEDLMQFIRSLETIQLEQKRFDVYFVNIIDYQFTKKYIIHVIDYNNQDSKIDIVYSFDSDGLTATHYYAFNWNGIPMFTNNDIDVKEIIENDGIDNIIERLLNLFHELSKD